MSLASFQPTHMRRNERFEANVCHNGIIYLNVSSWYLISACLILLGVLLSIPVLRREFGRQLVRISDPVGARRYLHVAILFGRQVPVKYLKTIHETVETTREF